MADPAASKHFSALLVDDHPDVLVGVGAYLTGAGFDVTRVGTGDEALSVLMSGQRFALLVTDYAMPGMNGVDLARQAREQVPELKILKSPASPAMQACSTGRQAWRCWPSRSGERH